MFQICDNYHHNDLFEKRLLSEIQLITYIYTRIIYIIHMIMQTPLK